MVYNFAKFLIDKINNYKFEIQDFSAKKITFEIDNTDYIFSREKNQLISPFIIDNESLSESVALVILEREEEEEKNSKTKSPSDSKTEVQNPATNNENPEKTAEELELENVWKTDIQIKKLKNSIPKNLAKFLARILKDQAKEKSKLFNLNFKEYQDEFFKLPKCANLKIRFSKLESKEAMNTIILIWQPDLQNKNLKYRAIVSIKNGFHIKFSPNTPAFLKEELKNLGTKILARLLLSKVSQEELFIKQQKLTKTEEKEKKESLKNIVKNINNGKLKLITTNSDSEYQLEYITLKEFREKFNIKTNQELYDFLIKTEINNDGKILVRFAEALLVRPVIAFYHDENKKSSCDIQEVENFLSNDTNKKYLLLRMLTTSKLINKSLTKENNINKNLKEKEPIHNKDLQLQLLFHLKKHKIESWADFARFFENKTPSDFLKQYPTFFDTDLKKNPKSLNTDLNKKLLPFVASIRKYTTEPLENILEENAKKLRIKI